MSDEITAEERRFLDQMEESEKNGFEAGFKAAAQRGISTSYHSKNEIDVFCYEAFREWQRQMSEEVRQLLLQVLKENS